MAKCRHLVDLALNNGCDVVLKIYDINVVVLNFCYNFASIKGVKSFFTRIITSLYTLYN